MSNDITATDVASAALEILREEGAESRAVYLSRLGTRLSARYRTPVRDLLGGKRLRNLLEEATGNAIEFEGHGASLAVRLRQEPEKIGTTIRFDPVVWAAFSKPISGSGVRYFRYDRPFEFWDTAAPAGATHVATIEETEIADPFLAKNERERLIIHNINEWCDRNSVPSATFALMKPTKRTPHAEAAISKPRQSSILRSLIEAVPEVERSKHTLSFDLIYHLLEK